MNRKRTNVSLPRFWCRLSITPANLRAAEEKTIMNMESMETMRTFIWGMMLMAVEYSQEEAETVVGVSSEPTMPTKYTMCGSVSARSFFIGSDLASMSKATYCVVYSVLSDAI